MISTVTNAHAQQEILLLAMKAGQIQLENGAEIFRVEDTIMHIAVPTDFILSISSC